MQINFSQNIDPVRLQTEFSLDQRLHIPDVFELDTAKNLFECLNKNTPWEMVFENKDTKKAQLVNAQEFAELTDEQKLSLYKLIQEQAKNDFQYFYHSYPMLDKYLEDANQMPVILKEFLDWLNTPRTLDVIRTICKTPQIIKADAQATRYGPNQFLNKHNDIPKGEQRVIAYVFNLSPIWNPNWGGHLQFYDELDNIQAGYTPSFNALNIFKVPREHAVSFIAPFAAAYRYSITGWFREA